MKHITLPVPEIPVRTWGDQLRKGLAWIRQSRRRLAWSLVGAGLLATGVVYLWRPSDSPEKAVKELTTAAREGDIRTFFGRVDAGSIRLLKSILADESFNGVIVSSQRGEGGAVVKLVTPHGQERNIPCVLEDGRWRVVLPR